MGVPDGPCSRGQLENTRVNRQDSILSLAEAALAADETDEETDDAAEEAEEDFAIFSVGRELQSCVESE